MKVLVLAVNGLHLGYLGCYGNDWIATPALDALAVESVVFDQHYAVCPDGAGAAWAWRTGHYLLPDPEGGPVPPPGAADLVRQLSAGGLATRLILAEDSGMPDWFANEWGAVQRIAGGQQLEAGWEAALDATVDILASLADQPHGLIWTQLPSLAPPWRLAEQFRDRYFDSDDEEEAAAPSLAPLLDPVPGQVAVADDDLRMRLQRTYAAAVSVADLCLGLLVEQLRQDALLEDLLLIVTSGHGLALGEHGLVGPLRPWLHEEVIHVPLLLRLPGPAQESRRVPALTQSIDLAPTLLETFGLGQPATAGRSLWPLVRGQTDTLHPYACCGWQVGEAVEWCLRTPQWGLVLPVRAAADDRQRERQLYVKPEDRWEVNDLALRHLEWAGQLEATLRAFAEAARQPGPLVPPPLPQPHETDHVEGDPS